MNKGEREYRNRRLLKLHCFDAIGTARYPGICAPFIQSGWRIATNGKSGVFLKNVHVDSPSLEVPDCSLIIKQYEQALTANDWFMVRLLDLPEALYRMEPCDSCDMDGCGECEERGYDFYSASPQGKYWLPFKDEYYLFDLDLIHRIDPVRTATFTVALHQKPEQMIAFFRFDDGFAAVMGITCDPDVAPPKPNRVTS